MDLVHDTSSEMCLKMYKVSSKYLLRVSSYRADTIFVMDRQTDGRTQGENNMSPHPSRGRHKYSLFVCVYAYQL